MKVVVILRVLLQMESGIFWVSTAKKTIVRVRVSLLDGLGETRKRIASERVQKYRQSVNFCVSFLCYCCKYNCLEELLNFRKFRILNNTKDWDVAMLNR